ncbi:hypothetical protein EDD21DRAFT_375472 [Dissophora ornata]|nr:hypothetical protein EDD21DRAFT_375472 [Dissophora ornata]
MSDNSESLTLTLEDSIDDLPEVEEEREISQENASSVRVILISLVSSFKEIPLKQSKTILGRSAEKCSEGAVLTGNKISGVHCEITSRSMNDAEAVIWIKDVSSNGVWVNEKRILKDEATKIFNKDIISFGPGPVNNNGDTPAFLLVDKREKTGIKDRHQEQSKRPNEEVSNEDEEPEKKKARADEDSAFEKEFSCGICHEIMHKALVLQPCLHAFCKECCKAWLSNSSGCPTCRQRVTKTKRDFKLNSLISVFLESRPHMKRDDIEDSGAVSDSSDVINAGHGAGRSRNNNDYGSDEEEESESDDDDYADGQNVPANFVFPATCPCCDLNNNLGYVCSDAVRIGPLPANPTYGDYMAYVQVKPGHTLCRDCRAHLPLIPPTAQGTVADRFICKMCLIPTCGCQTRSVEDNISQHIPVDSYVNPVEATIINNYLDDNNLTPDSVWEEIKQGMDNGQFSYLGTSDRPATHGRGVSSSHKLCSRCGSRFFIHGPLYQWRIALDPARLPATVTDREDCWWGRECRTQFNITNRAHAERLNHMCEKRRGRD